jgi:signal transduction histidine kinase
MIDAARHSLTGVQPPQVESADTQLGSVMAALNKTTGDIRGTIFDLRRSIAGDEDLTRGLLDIVTEFRLRTTIMTDWSVQGCGQFKIAPERRYHVYQIAREALSNIARHSAATRARVELKYEDCEGDIASGLTLTISDNGRGSAGSERVGKGLLNMRERATLLKGDFDIHSENGRGTRVELRVYS